MRAIHQIVAGFAHGDAISNEARTLTALFRSWGFESELYCEPVRVLPDLRASVRDIASAAATIRPDDIVLLHLSTGSAVNDCFARLACRKAILYHNVTPPDWFRFVNPQTAAGLDQGLRQVADLAGSAAVCMADSAFNARELEAVGYRDVKVLPLVLDFSRMEATDRRVERRLRDGRHTILFVGRCAPNKKIEDVITAFFYFQRWVEPRSRLVLAGSYAGAERYYRLLMTRVRELGLADVRFTGSIPQAELNACYRSASLFLCMSEHEGFCIPLIESLYHGVPVMAFAAAAVPETLDGSGILFREKSFEAIAEMMGRVCRDTALRDAVVRRQSERLAAYRGRDLAAELKAHLAPLLA